MRRALSPREAEELASALGFSNNDDNNDDSDDQAGVFQPAGHSSSPHDTTMGEDAAAEAEQYSRPQAAASTIGRSTLVEFDDEEGSDIESLSPVASSTRFAQTAS